LDKEGVLKMFVVKTNMGYLKCDGSVFYHTDDKNKATKFNTEGEAYNKYMFLLSKGYDCKIESV
jgi:hypothetical protein